MTTEEFSNEFDVYTKAYSVNYDEYEKSVFLTKALEMVVIALYDGTLTGEGFDKTEKSRRYIQHLVKSKNYEGFKNYNGIWQTVDKEAEDVLFTVMEQATIEVNSNAVEVPVVPIKFDEYQKTIRNPFRKPSNRKVLRVNINGKNGLISNYDLLSYQLTYLERPDPIILVDLQDSGLSINNQTEVTECLLDNSVHHTILEYAIKLALSTIPRSNNV